MKRFKRFQCFLFLCIWITTYAQERGIKWTENLTWQQVKAKAKKESKYIFVDCYATWCGPCKKMDNEVYPNDTIATFFNQNFISVKVQMDKTKNDNAFIQSWYDDAEAMNKQYRVQGYPTFIFLSPEGTVVNQVLGYQSVNELVSAAQTATKPRQVYLNPFAAYDSLVAEYKKGLRNYDLIPYMIKTAFQLGENEFGKQLLSEHADYVAALPKEKRYSKENIELWSGFRLRSSSKLFQFFYDDRDFIDKVMARKGYANGIIDRTVQYEIVDSFFKTQPSGVIMSSELIGPFFRTSSDVKADKTEANWNKLYKILTQKFRVEDSKRNLISAKLDWYQKHYNYTSYLKYYWMKLKEFPPDFSDYRDRESINRCAYDIVFMNISDVKILIQFSDLMKKCLDEEAREQKLNVGHVDTYANLLYKAGKWNEAIRWEEKAAENARILDKTDSVFYPELINRMRSRQPTNLYRAAIWEGISWVNWKGAFLPRVIFVQDENRKPILNAVAILQRTGESKPIDQQFKEFGYAIFENIYVGDEILIFKNGYAKQTITVGKNPWATVIIFKKLTRIKTKKS